MKPSRTLAGVSGFFIVAVLSTTGCATKKYVRTQTSPIQQRVDEVEKKHSEAIASLEGKEQKDVSRVEERTMTAENKANDAARAAQQADQRAQDAAQSAQNATNLAQQAQSRLGDLSNAVQNIDTYKMISSEDVLFGFNRATLTPDARQKLEQLVQQTNSVPRFIIEVEGFTDKSGPQDYNLALSRRRADAVVRYLVDHGVALRRIHMIGLGEQQAPATQAMAGQTSGTMGQTSMAAQTGTTSPKMSRKEQRRVMVLVWAPEATLSASNDQNQSNQRSQPMNQQPARPQP